jgi:NADP-dependent 3-hydroxy acid dehydrogenase YdfG
VAIVTGASAGIGWAVCETLAAAGMRVVAVARRRERLESLQQLLVSRGVPIADFLPVVCDITKACSSPALGILQSAVEHSESLAICPSMPLQVPAVHALAHTVSLFSNLV